MGDEGVLAWGQGGKSSPILGVWKWPPLSPWFYLSVPVSCHCPQAGFRKLQGKTELLGASLDQEDGKWERGKQVETGKGARGQWEGK